MRVLFLALLFSSSVQAADLSGRLKLDALGYNAGADSPEAALSYEKNSEVAGQLRLGVSQQLQQWKFEGAWQLDARHGSAVQRDHAIATAYPALAGSSTDTSYWDLKDTITDSNNTIINQRLDRLNLSYSNNALVMRLGRQALTWGSGLVFHPMDLVNPFQPVATDTVYKRGTDMAYLQWLLADGSDIQLVGVPHKTRDTQDPDGNKSTQALFANIVGDTLQWNFLLAKDRADSVLGIGASGPWGGAVWNLELIPTYLERHATRTSALMNLSYADTFMQRNITTFAEYYHNGFGESGSDYSLADLNADLLLRLQRRCDLGMDSAVATAAYFHPQPAGSQQPVRPAAQPLPRQRHQFQSRPEACARWSWYRIRRTGNIYRERALPRQVEPGVRAFGNLLLKRVWSVEPFNQPSFFK
jgi:hypothetical protein